MRYGFRTFDRQWIIPDNRLLLSARQTSGAYTLGQVFLAALMGTAPNNGPALSVLIGSLIKTTTMDVVVVSFPSGPTALNQGQTSGLRSSAA